MKELFAFLFFRGRISALCAFDGTFHTAQKTGNANVTIIYHTFSQKTTLGAGARPRCRDPNIEFQFKSRLGAPRAPAHPLMTAADFLLCSY